MMLIRIWFMPLRTLAVLTLALVIAACGGGGGSNNNPPPAPPAPSPSYEKATITPEGGEYRLANGVVLSVPAGAVSRDTVIALRLIPESGITPVLASDGKTNKKVLAAVQAQGTGLSFSQPVTLALPLAGPLSPSALPSLLVVDTKHGIYSFDTPPRIATPAGQVRAAAASGYPATKYIKYDCEANQVIIFNLDHLPDDDRALIIAGIDELREESDCFDNPCRCCDIRVQEQTLDVVRESGSGGCFNSLVQGTVQYLSCDGQPTETYEIREDSLGGRVGLRPDQLELEVGGGAAVSMNVVDALGRNLDFYAIRRIPSSDPDVASVSTIETDLGRFNVLGHEPGSATLSVTLDCSITRDLPVTVSPLKVITDREDLIVPEGKTSTFRIRLNGPVPEGKVVILILGRESGDPDIAVSGVTTFTFDSNNWADYQSAALVAAEDDDLVNGTAVISLFSDSPLIEDRILNATEADNDIQQIVASTGSVLVPEGGNAEFTVRLSSMPDDPLTVNVIHVAGDPDIGIVSGGTLVFSADNWSIEQTVVLNAAEDDDDIANGVATLSITDAAGLIDAVQVRAVEADNDNLDLLVTPGNLCVERGRTAKLSAIASTAVDFSRLTWSSSDETVATVDATGMVTAKGDGPAQIIAAVDAVQANATIEVREHCVWLDRPSLCLHAPLPDATELFPTNLTKPLPHVETALAGHGISLSSSDETVASVDVTGLVTAVGGGTAEVTISVDNVVTRYQLDNLPVTVASDLDAYNVVPLSIPTGTGGAFLTDRREIYTHEQIVARLEEAAAKCGGFPSAPDTYKITDFNNKDEYVGYSGGTGLYFDTRRCIFESLDPEGTVVYWRLLSINDRGDIVGSVLSDDPRRMVYITPEHTLHRWWSGTPIKLNNNGWLLTYDEASTDPNNRGIDPKFNQCHKWFYVWDIARYGEQEALISMLAKDTECADPYYASLNNSNVLLGGYLWGQWEPSDIFNLDFYYTYVDGVFLRYGDVIYDLPFGSAYGGLDINDSQDILLSSDTTYSVAHICPFSLETNVCQWIGDNAARSQSIEGYEEIETRCDGLDNDCDGFVDTLLVAPLASKQEGVCAGAVKTCGGKQGWLDDYSRVQGYEFPEVSCDGKDNDCDGLVDEGCPVGGS